MMKGYRKIGNTIKLVLKTKYILYMYIQSNFVWRTPYNKGHFLVEPVESRSNSHRKIYI